MGATVPAGGLWLRYGDAITLTPGLPAGAPIVAPGETFADGQARTLPVTFAWLRHFGPASLGAVVDSWTMGLGACGIGRLWADGNEHLPVGFRPLAWAGPKLPGSVAGLHTWDRPIVGPSPRSNDTGAQEDQVFVGGEALPSGGAGAEQVRYLAALKLANRPCHHLEIDGSTLDPSRHVDPRLLCWDGRAHWHTGVSPDQLGKPRGLDITESRGWWGPDVEHWLYQTAFAAARLTGSPAIQAELSTQANIYLLTCTTVPGWANSGWFAARAVGWECIMAVNLWRQIEDRGLADRVRARCEDRIRLVFVPQLNPKPAGIWDVRTDDPRLGPGAWWIPWQQGVGAYGIDLAGAVFGVADARDLGYTAASAVLRDAWVKVGSRWQSQAQRPVAGATASDESFNLFGMPLAVAVVLSHDGSDAKARAIWQQITTDATLTTQTSWLAPAIQ